MGDTSDIRPDHTHRYEIAADFSLKGAQVVAVLERLKGTIGLPQRIAVDNGPEFISKVLDAWAYRNGVKLEFSRPGKPTDNAYAESFNGHFREECLNQHWFATLAEAREVIEAWRVEDHEERPHRSLQQRTPAAFLANWEPLARAADYPQGGPIWRQVNDMTGSHHRQPLLVEMPMPRLVTLALTTTRSQRRVARR